MFSARRAQRAHDQEALQAQLSQHIGPLKVELDWLEKKWECSPEASSLSERKCYGERQGFETRPSSTICPRKTT